MKIFYFIVFFIQFTLIHSDDLNDKIGSFIAESKVEDFLHELEENGVKEDQLAEIVEFCKDSENKLYCLTTNIHKTILMKRHNLELCVSSYVMYTGVACMDSCLKAFSLGCMECIGDNIPFFIDCVANGHIDYRPDFK